MRLLLILLFFFSCGKSSSQNESISLLASLSRYQLPGWGKIALKDGTIQELHVEGVRKYGDPMSILPDDKFHLGSCSKAMTATLAAVLVEEGKLQWHTTMSELLPDFNLHPSYQSMSFDTLLVHRAGLSRTKDHWLFGVIQSPSYTSTSAREFMARTILELPPETSPGAVYQYSNSHYIIAGYILEKITGRSWEDLMKEKIFSPLGMNSCGFGPTSPENVWGHEELRPVHIDNPEAFGPGARIHCSLSDWGKFLQEHINGFNGVNGIVKATTFTKLHSQANIDSPYTYGGWLRYERPWASGPTLTHDGSNTINYAKVWFAPRLKLGVAAVTNTGGTDAQKATEELISDMIKRQNSTFP